MLHGTLSNKYSVGHAEILTKISMLKNIFYIQITKYHVKKVHDKVTDLPGITRWAVDRNEESNALLKEELKRAREREREREGEGGGEGAGPRVPAPHTHTHTAKGGVIRGSVSAVCACIAEDNSRPDKVLSPTIIKSSRSPHHSTGLQ